MVAVERDEALRTAYFLALDVLRAQFGDEPPYKGALDRGFSFHGPPRIPFLNFQKGNASNCRDAPHCVPTRSASRSASTLSLQPDAL